jgi:hypothetical protein
VCNFAQKDELTILFLKELQGADSNSKDDGGAYQTMAADDGIGYLPWRSADFVFSSIQPFFSSETYS